MAKRIRRKLRPSKQAATGREVQAGEDRRLTLPGCLFMLAVAAGILSFVVGERQDVYEEMERTVRKARATLVSTEVREWIPGRNHWSAFGTFDIVAGDYTGKAEGSLIPSSYYRGKPRRYKVPRAEAEAVLPRWEIGRTYDGYWDPDHPGGVFFEMVDARANARMIWALRIAAGALLILSVAATALRARRVPVSGSS
jgi:hypothetical protein